MRDHRHRANSVTHGARWQLPESEMRIIDIEDASAGWDRPHCEGSINLEYGAAEEKGKLRGLSGSNLDKDEENLWGLRPAKFTQRIAQNFSGFQRFGGGHYLQSPSRRLFLGCVILAPTARRGTSATLGKP